MTKRSPKSTVISFGLVLSNSWLCSTEATDTIVTSSNATASANITFAVATDGDESDSYVLSIPSQQQQEEEEEEEEEEDFIPCPLCPDPAHEPLDKIARFDTGGAVVTCEYAFSESFHLRLPQAQCTEFQEWGTSLCHCGAVAATGGDMNGSAANDGEAVPFFCPLCQDGSPLPYPALAGLPNQACAQLQIQATRDDPSMCSIYQATIGTYCGCPYYNSSTNTDNDVTSSPPSSTVICRICGDHPLSNHLQTVGGHRSQTCGELEFHANQPDSQHDCQLFQKLYAQDCCGVIVTVDGDDTENETNDVTSSAALANIKTSTSSKNARFLIAILLVVEVILSV